MRQSGQEIAKVNLVKFESWMQERHAANDWKRYRRGDKLNRSEIAKECGFALSVLRQNPAVKECLQALESSLRGDGILGADDRPGEIKASERRTRISIGSDRDRIKRLEEQMESLRAENQSLKQKLQQAALFSEHLAETGRAIKL